MDILDRLLGHDIWTTRQLLSRCRELTADQWHQPFDVGNGSVSATLRHMLGNIRVWTDLVIGRPVRPRLEIVLESADTWLEHFDTEYTAFAALARQLTDEGRLDDYFTDTLDTPPTRKTCGGAIAHVILHNMHHRGELLHMLARLGVQNVLEGDLLSWEQSASASKIKND